MDLIKAIEKELDRLHDEVDIEENTDSPPNYLPEEIARISRFKLVKSFSRILQDLKENGKKLESNKKLLKQYEYELKEWLPILLSAPVRLVKTGDKSPAWEMDRFHVFELENGQYATVLECGCSCYDYGDADIELFPDEESAMKKYDEWEKESY